MPSLLRATTPVKNGALRIGVTRAPSTVYFYDEKQLRPLSAGGIARCRLRILFHRLVYAREYSNHSPDQAWARLQSEALGRYPHRVSGLFFVRWKIQTDIGQSRLRGRYEDQ